MKTKIAFIINPFSGTGKKEDIPELIQNGLDTGIFEPEIVFTGHRGHGTELAREFVEKGFPIVVAVGGDGTVNEVGRSLIHTSSSLGIIPIGSGNGLARHLGIPMNTKKAIKQLGRSEPIMMDYGLVNERPFFCTCGTGFDAYVSTEFAKGKKRGVMSYIEKIITGYFTYKSQNYHLEGEGIDLNSKALDISIMSNFPIIAIPTLALQLFAKTIDKDLFMTTLRSKDITLLREESGPFHYDGEPYEEGKEIFIKTVPDGLRVLVNKRY